MKRRTFIAGLGGAAAWPLVARAQQPERMRRVGVLLGYAEGDREAQRRIVAFQQSLQSLGWTDGRNVHVFKRVAILFNPETAPYVAKYLSVIDAVSASFSMDAIATPIHDATDVERAIESFAREPNGGLLFPGDITTIVHSELIVALGAKHHLPAIYTYSFWAARGGLISYGTDPVDLYRRAASYVDRILRGEKPADLPVQSPTKFELVINLRTAKVLGLTFPPTLLSQADEVIE